MPINVFGNSSNNSDNKIDTSLFVQKPCLRNSQLESNIEEDIDLKNQMRIQNLPDLFSIRDAASKNFVDSLFNDPSILKNKTHIDLNGRNNNARFIQVNQLPRIDSHLTAKLYVDNSVDEPSLVRNNQKNDFNTYNLTNISSITLNEQAERDIEVITKAYVDQFHQEKERSRRDLGIDFYNESSDLVKDNQDNGFNDNKFSDNELSSKKYIDDDLDKNTIFRFDQTLQNFLKVTIGTDIYNLIKYNEIQITDTSIIIIYPNIGNDPLQRWKTLRNDKITIPNRKLH